MGLVFVPDKMCGDCSIEKKVLGDAHTLKLGKVESLSEVDGQLMAQMDAMMLWHEVQLDSESISRMKNCKIVVRVGAGIDNIDLKAAKAQGLLVSAISDYGTEDVADHTVALALSVARGLDRFQFQVMDREWAWDAEWPRRRLRSMTLGLVGLGRIGTAVAMRSKAFFKEILFFDPFKERGIEKALQIGRVESLQDLCGQADIVSFHCPLTSETANLAGESFFSNCREGLIVINTARGGIVDLNALHSAMKSGKVFAAGLDVHHSEPNYNHPLIHSYLCEEEWLKGRLILTPHAAFLNHHAMLELRTKAAVEVVRVLAGETPLYRCA